MIAIISAACTFPSGPTLPLANISQRLQFSLIRKHPQYVDQCGSPIKACYFPEIIHATTIKRFQQLARQVLTELVEYQPHLARIIPRRICLLLPPLDRPEITLELATAVRNTITEIWNKSDICILHGGAAEIVTAIEVTEADQTNAVDILLAIDSWLPPLSLMWLEKQNLLHSSSQYFNGRPHPNPYGRIPSEGAAALALTGDTGNILPWCSILGTGEADEPTLYSTDDVCLGEGLTQAALQALNMARVTTLHNIISDVNGEPCRADELGFTLLRLGNALNRDYQQETPVLASGDLGCVNLLMHMALTAWRMQSLEQSGDTLLLSSSDDGQRGAVVMSKDEGPEK